MGELKFLSRVVTFDGWNVLRLVEFLFLNELNVGTPLWEKAWRVAWSNLASAYSSCEL